MSKRLDEIFRRFFAPDDGGGQGGEGGEGAGGGSGEGAGDGGEGGEGSGEGSSGEGGQGGEGEGGSGGDDGAGSLLGGDEGEGGEGEGQQAKPPTPEEVTKFTEAIKVKGADGKDIEIDKEAIAALAPVLMKHKLTPETASELVGVYAAYAAQAQTKAQTAHMEQVKAVRDASVKEFGEDLPRMAKEANAGGKAIFGKFWQILRGIPEFCNQPDVIRGLAAHGRSISNDQGAGGDGGGDDGKDKGFSADDWIKHSNERGRSTAGE